MTSSNISYHPTDPKDLCDERLGQIFEIEQDMWAREEGLGEYLECSACNTVYSKQDIYNGLEKGRYNLTVSELEEIEDRDIFCCQSCQGKLTHSFAKDAYMEAIHDRYTSRTALILMEKDDQLIGFMDGYVDDIETIYRRELADHYGDIGIERVTQMVRTSLDGCLPSEFFSCSSSGTRERYMNMIHIYNLLQKFFENFPEEMLGVTALSELHAGGPYTRMFSSLGAKSIGIRDAHEDLIQTTNTYASDIYVHENFGKACRKAFCGVSRKDFLNDMN